MINEAFERQVKILEEHKQENEASYKLHLEFYLKKVYPIFESKINGPYVVYICRHYSNGKSLNFYQAASLGWAVGILDPITHLEIFK